MNKLDSNVLVWLVTLVFLAGGGWMSLGSVEDRVNDLETQDGETAMDIRQIMTNQAAICVAVDADCSR